MELGTQADYFRSRAWYIPYASVPRYNAQPMCPVLNRNKRNNWLLQGYELNSTVLRVAGLCQRSLVCSSVFCLRVELWLGFVVLPLRVRFGVG